MKSSKDSDFSLVSSKDLIKILPWNTCSGPKNLSQKGLNLPHLWLEIGRYLGFAGISVSAKTADIIGHNRSWQNAVIFFTHPDNLRKKAQRSKSRQLSYNNASRCGFINKQTRLTMEHVLAVTTKTKASSGSFAILEATMCRCCVWINSRYTSGSFCSLKSLTGT